MRFEHVRRERNVEADALANRGVDEWLSGEGASWERSPASPRLWERRRNRGDEVLQRELEPKRPRSGPVDEREHASIRGALRLEDHEPLDGLARRYGADRRREGSFDALEPVAAIDEQGGPVGASETACGAAFSITTLNCHLGGNMKSESRCTVTPPVRTWRRKGWMLSDIGTPLRSRSSTR